MNNIRTGQIFPVRFFWYNRRILDIMNRRIILASGSPRRKELLTQVGLKFEIIPAVGEEITASKEPDKTVLELSYNKTLEIQQSEGKSAVIIGADTVVAHEGRILGKPKDREDAVKMISALRNGCHSVFTGVTILYEETVKSFVAETKVYVYDMTDAEVEKYINFGECYDKAGAYGIQGAFAEYVEKIEGDYNNVVGMPVSRLMKELKNMEVF